MAKKFGVVLVGCGQIMTHHVEQMALVGSDSNVNQDKSSSSSSLSPYQVVAVCDPNPKRRQIIFDWCQQCDLISSSKSIGSMEFNSLTDFLQYNHNDEIPHDKDNNVNTETVMMMMKKKEKLIILLALPHYLHESIALEALASGNYVVLEKPLAPSLESCQVLQKASLSMSMSEDDVGMLIVAEQSPYWEEIVLAKSLIQQGAIGTVVSAASYFYESMRDNVTSGIDEANGGGLGWRCSLEKAGGGIVLDGGLHWIRPLRELCGGQVERVVGVTRCHVQPEMKMEGETLAHAIIQMKTPSHSLDIEKDSGSNDQVKTNYLTQPLNSGPLYVTLSCNAMHVAPMAYDTCPYFRITGTQGELVVSGTGLNPNGGGGLKLYNEENISGKDLIPADRQGAFFLGFRGLWKEISRIIQENDRVAAAKTVEEAAKDVAVALAVYESAKCGQWVTL